MTRPRFGSSHLAGALLILFITVPALGQSCDDISFRIWRPDGEQTHYAKGELIRLAQGVEAHLYVHHSSQSASPYTTNATIGDPQKLGIRGQFDASILSLRPQNDDHRRTGHVVLNTKAPGRTRLGYRINAITKAGVFERLPEICRHGLVTIEVIGQETRRGDRAPAAARQAARRLTHGIEKALLPWIKAEVDDEELGNISRDGRQGLVRHAASLMRSDSFQNDSYYEIIEIDPRLRVEAERRDDIDPERVAEVALEIAYRQLYGEVRPEGKLHKANLEALLACVTEEGTQRDYACDNLAERLLASPAYTQRHRDALAEIDRAR